MIALDLGLRSSQARIIHAFEFQSAARSSGAFTLPSWMAIACATTSRTAQQSASTLRTGYGANAARAESVDGTTWGLLVEHSRTNGVLRSDSMTGANWGAGAMARVESQADPAGGTSAVQFTSTGDQYSEYDLGGNAGQTASVWAQRVSGASPSAHIRFQAVDVYANVVSTNWTRLDFTEAVSNVGYVNFETRDLPTGAGVLAGTRVFCGYGAQAEAGKYPTSYLPNTTTARTRAADVLAVASAAAICPGGFLDVRMLFAPLYANTEQSADHDLFFWTATTVCSFAKQTQKSCFASAVATLRRAH